MWRRAASAAGRLGLLSTAGTEAPPLRIAAAMTFLAVEAYDGDGVIYVVPPGVASA